MSQTVAVLGASQNAERYSFKAFRMLREYGHAVIPIHPSLDQVENVAVKHHLMEIPSGTVDTLTIYVNASISDALSGDIIKLRPRRVIFNPGSENPKLARALEEKGIHVVEACTLVLLRTGQFETA